MDEKALNAYYSLAAALSAHARSKSAQNDDAQHRAHYPDLAISEAIYSNDFMSTFEAVDGILQRLGITRALDRCCSAIVCDPRQERELIHANRANGPSFDDLLYAFIDLFSEFGTGYWGFDTSFTAPFKPKRPEMAAAMEALFQAGYAAKTPDGFLWSAKAKPAIVATGLSSDRDIS